MILVITEELLRKTCHCSVLPITNPTWTELVANLSLHDEMPVTDCLIHGTAYSVTLLKDIRKLNGMAFVLVPVVLNDPY
jgi:hypothetical protein